MARAVIELGSRVVGWYVHQRAHGWRTAARWMTPRRPVDPHVARLQAWRSWLGYGSVVVAVGVSREASTGPAERVLRGVAVGFELTALVAVLVFLVSALVIVRRSHVARRREWLRAAARPFGLLLTVIGLSVFVVLYLRWTRERPAGGFVVQVETPVFVLAGFVFVVFMPFLLVAAAAAVVLGVRHLFCAGDVHPLLPSVLAFVVAVASGVANAAAASQPTVGLDRTLSLLGVGGAVAVLLLTGYEHHRLRQVGWRWADL